MPFSQETLAVENAKTLQQRQCEVSERPQQLVGHEDRLLRGSFGEAELQVFGNVEVGRG